MSDEEQEYGYVCEGCYSTADEHGQRSEEDKIRRDIPDRGTAEALAQIHRVKTNGHEPEVRRFS